MRLVTFVRAGQPPRLGAWLTRDEHNYVLDLQQAQPDIPGEMLAFLNAGEKARALAQAACAAPPPTSLWPEASVTLQAPVLRPGKIVCVGHNYVGHIGQGRTEPPAYPTLFCKTVNTISGPDAPIVIPRVSQQVDFEAELAVIIGRRGRYVPEAQALEYVAGYSIFNDVSARDYQKRTTQWMVGKSFDTFGPLGPALVTPDEIPDPQALELVLTLNGVERQRTNTRYFIFSVAYLIAYLSAVMTLEPGDVLATGTPAKLEAPPGTPPFMQAGDVVQITIDRLGCLTNPVVAEA